MSWNRRKFLGLAPTALAAEQLHAQGILHRKPKVKAPATQYAYFGTDTAREGAKGIYVAKFDSVKGQFSEPVLATESYRPMFLAVNRAGNRRLLYAANESDAKSSTITTYMVDPATAALRQTGQVSAGGAGPCYITLDATDRFAYVANYAGGTVAAFRINPDGTLQPPGQVVDLHEKPFGKHGPNVARQDAPHPHSATISPQNRFLLVNDLGLDTIAIFPMHGDGGLGSPTLVETHPGSGPRHIAFHPNGRWAYGVDELSNRVDCYLWSTTHASGGADGKAILTDMRRSVSTLDEGFKGQNTAAEIMVSANGYYVYVSNRGENSIVVFAVDQASGGLTFVQRISCGGKAPRHFTFDPSGNWLVCGNQDSASVTVFAKDSTSGKLSGPVQTLPLESPVFTLFL